MGLVHEITSYSVYSTIGYIPSWGSLMYAPQLRNRGGGKRTQIDIYINFNDMKSWITDINLKMENDKIHL